MGRFYVARLNYGEAVPLIPVDVASWQSDSAGEIMPCCAAPPTPASCYGVRGVVWPSSRIELGDTSVLDAELLLEQGDLVGQAFALGSLPGGWLRASAAQPRV